MFQDFADTDIIHGFNYQAEFKELNDGRVKATTTVGGKTFEVFEDTLQWAQRKLQDTVTEAVQTGDVTLNSY